MTAFARIGQLETGLLIAGGAILVVLGAFVFFGVAAPYFGSSSTVGIDLFVSAALVILAGLATLQWRPAHRPTERARTRAVPRPRSAPPSSLPATEPDPAPTPSPKAYELRPDRLPPISPDRRPMIADSIPGAYSRLMSTESAGAAPWDESEPPFSAPLPFSAAIPRIGAVAESPATPSVPRGPRPPATPSLPARGGGAAVPGEPVPAAGPRPREPPSFREAGTAGRDCVGCGRSIGATPAPPLCWGCGRTLCTACYWKYGAPEERHRCPACQGRRSAPAATSLSGGRAGASATAAVGSTGPPIGPR